MEESLREQPHTRLLLPPLAESPMHRANAIQCSQGAASRIAVISPASTTAPKNQGHLQLADKPRVKLREARLIAIGAAKYRATWNVSSRTCVNGTD